MRNYESYTVNDNGELVFKGVIIAYAERPNTNKRYFPEEVLKEALELWKEIRKIDATYNYILINHPRDTYEEDIRNIAGWIDDMYYDENTKSLKADFRILPFTQYGMIVYKLLKNGYPIGLSLRGDGKLKKAKIKFAGDEIEVDKVIKLVLKGFDFVIYPSFIDTILKTEKFDFENSPETVSIVEKYINGEIDKDELKRILDKYRSSICDRNLCYLVENNQEEIAKIYEKSENILEINISEVELNQRSKGGINMGNVDLTKEIEALELKKERITLELFRKEKEYAEITEKVKSLEQRKEELEKEVNKEQAKKDVLLDEIIKLEKEKEQKIAEKEELEKKIEELVKKIEELDNQLKHIYEQEKRNKVVVKFMGKVYDENNRPKVRIVDEAEKISTRRWGEIEKTTLRKLIWLTNDEKVIKECFALLDDGWEGDWSQLKYPHHELVKSDDPEYDFDLVLNVNGLRIAVLFMLGRAGMRLTPEQKRNMAKHFLKHYQRLYDLGKIDKIPFEEALTRIANTKVMFKTESDNIDAQVLETILNELVFRGYLDVEIDEYITEKNSDRESDVKYLKIEETNVGDFYRKLVRGLVEEYERQKENATSSYSSSKESDVVVIDLSNFETVTEFMQKIHEQGGELENQIRQAFEELYNNLVYDAQGEYTGFAQKYSIENRNHFAMFIHTLVLNATQQEFDMLNEKYQGMVITYTLRKLEASQIETAEDIIMNTTRFITDFFKYLAVLMSNIDFVLKLYGINNNNTEGQQQQYNNEERQYGNEQTGAGNYPNEQPQENMTNTTQENTGENYQENETQIFEKFMNEGDNKKLSEVEEMRKLERIVQILNEHISLPDGSEATVDNVVEVIEKVVKSYTDIYNLLEGYELEKKIYEKKLDLVKRGIPEDVIETELKDIETDEELEKIYEKLIKTYTEEKPIQEKSGTKNENIEPKRQLTDNAVVEGDDDNDITLINV